MKKYFFLFPLLFLFFLVPKAHAAPLFVNAASTNVNVVSVTVNVSSTNLLVVTCMSTNSFFASVSDTALNTYTKVGEIGSSQSGFLSTFYTVEAAATTTDTITCPFTGNSPQIAVNQYSGMAQSSVVDKVVTSTAGFSSSITSPSFTTSQASEVAYFTTWSSGSNLTHCTATDGVPNTYNTRNNTPNGSVCNGDSIYSAVATANQTTIQNAGNGEFWAALIATFKAAAAPTGLSCVITTSTCNYPSIGILFLATSTNSHAALASSSGYTNIVCCSGIGSLGNSCSGVGATTTFVHLASSTNSHVEENTQNNYPTSSYACLSVGLGGTVSVGYVTSTSCTTAGFDTALFSISSTTNAHVGPVGSSTFQAGSTIQVCASATTPVPVVSNVVLNNANPIVLTPNATTSVTLSYTVSDYTTNGCSDVFTSGHVTSTAFLGFVSSTCENNPTANNLNCYVTSLAGSVNSCGGSTSTSATATDTLNIYYIARSSGVPSSSYPSDHWYGFASIMTQSGVTSSATSSFVDVNALSALSLSTSTINFGSIPPNTNTGAINQSLVISNVGNSSNTPQLSGTTFVRGANSFATSSEHYATTTFTFGGAEQQMNSSPTTIPGIVLTAPTVAGTNPSSTIYFGLQVPFAVASGTYTATDTFTGLFSN